MAQHVLTFAQLKDEASHAISGTPDARTSLDRIVNGALEYLCQMFPWSWRQSITTLSLTANQAHVELPEDFGRVVALEPAAAGFGLLKVTPRGVAAARSGAANTGGRLAYCLGQSPQTDPAVSPRRRLELGPVPAADAPDAFTLVYLANVPALAGPSDVPAIPYGLFEPLRVLCRAMAVSSTTQQAGHDWDLFNRIIGDYTAADGLADGSNAGSLPSALDGFDAAYGSAEPTLSAGTQILMPGDF